MNKLLFRNRYNTTTLVLTGLLLTGVILLNAVMTSTDNRSRAQDQIPTTVMLTSGIEKFLGQINPAIPSVPAYPGAQVAYSYIKHDGPRTGYEITWQSRDSVATIAQWYVTAFPAAGWTLTKVPESLATITPPGPASSVEFMIVAQNGATEVHLIVNNEGNEMNSEISAEFPVTQ